ncbi:hypothetical protein [Sporosarcina sp. D27]|uniref:hypothetical protein n=1 Tax=Sporosarcina sp. D27 TaxID=1382305 RepID=UPI00046EA04B|nr:hypothetical protein [Sporosarcina sp. D27]
MIDFFERKLRLQNLEVWDVQCGESFYRMFIFDENRLPELADLDIPSNAIADDLRENLITVSVYSNTLVKDEHIVYLDQFAKQLTDHVALAHCHVVTKFYTGEIDDMSKWFLKEKINLNYEELPLTQLWHLNQDN